MFKGYKVTKHLQRYMGYAQKKYDKLRYKEEVDLWNVLAEYDYIMQQPKCVQMFIYDMICDKLVHHGQYSVLRNVDGCIYIKSIVKKECLSERT